MENNESYIGMTKKFKVIYKFFYLLKYDEPKIAFFVINMKWFTMNTKIKISIDSFAYFSLRYLVSNAC